MNGNLYVSRCRMFGDKIDECQERGKDGLSCGNCMQVIWVKRSKKTTQTPKEQEKTNEQI